MKQDTKTILMWCVFLIAGVIGFFGEFEIPLGWYVVVLAIAVAFVDEKYARKISALERKIGDLSEKLNELDMFVDEKLND